MDWKFGRTFDSKGQLTPGTKAVRPSWQMMDFDFRQSLIADI